METFIGIAAEPRQQHDAGQLQRRRLPADPAGCGLPLRVRQGDRPASGPREGRRADRHRRRTGWVTHGDRIPEPAVQKATGGHAHRGLPVALAARHGTVLPVPARGHGLLLLHELRRVHPADTQRAGQLEVRLRGLPVLLAGPGEHPVAGGGDGDAAGDLRPEHRHADHEDQAGCGGAAHAVLHPLPGTAGCGDDGVRLPAQPRHRTGQRPARQGRVSTNRAGSTTRPGPSRR